MSSLASKFLCALKKISLYSLIAFTLSCSTNSSQRHPANEADFELALDSVSIDTIRETADDIVESSERSQFLLYAHTEANAMRFFDEHQSKLNVNRNVWKKLVRSMVLSMREVKLGYQILKRFSKPASVTLMATTITTNILPFVLLAIDQPFLSFIVTAVQWELVIPPIHIAIMSFAKYKSRIHTYGKTDYDSAIELRKSLIGMTERSRIITLMDEKFIRDLSDDASLKWVSISSKAISENTILGQSVSLYELANIVSKMPNGKKLLYEIKDSYSMRAVYAMELWLIIKSNEKATSELKNLLKKRLPKETDGEMIQLARQLSLTRDLYTALTKAEETLLDSLKTAKSYAPKAERLELQKIANEVNDVKLRLMNAINDVELHILVSKTRGTTPMFRIDDLLDFANDLYTRYHETIPLVENLRHDRLITTQTIRKKLEFINPILPHHNPSCFAKFKMLFSN